MSEARLALRRTALLLTLSTALAMSNDTAWGSDLQILTTGGSALEELATKEVERYAGLHAVAVNAIEASTLAQLERISARSTADSTGTVVIGTLGSALLAALGASDGELEAALARLQTSADDDTHLLAYTTLPGFRATGRSHSVTLCVGKSPRAALYAAYTLVESCGLARFLLHGDVVQPVSAATTRCLVARPSPPPPLLFVPKFATRGLQPFHDFPMGPDFWDESFWRALASNMARLKLNFFGFHTYPVAKGGVGGITEPEVWIGTQDGFSNTTGDVFPAEAYETSWYLTEDFWATGTEKVRGNVPGQVSRSTSSYCCGAALPFEDDCFGSPAQRSTCYPKTPEAKASVINNAAALLRGAFQWARDMAGVESAVGVEVPLQLTPALVAANATLFDAYRGIFSRIVAANIPISTFWLWTSENVEDHSTGKGYPQSNPLWRQLVDEIHVALDALASVQGANFSLGTNGWCVGPGDNATYFEEEMSDPRFTVAAINGALGWLPPDEAFSKMGSRGWSIPWMEDDLALAGGELWVNRTLEFSQLSYEAGSGGLLGLTWRTFETSPQISALANSAWEVVPLGERDAGEHAPPSTDRDFFLSFCSSSFGSGTAEECASLFLSLDSFASDYKPPTPPYIGGTKIPRDGQMCCGGPMDVVAVPASHALETASWDHWLQHVEGVENVERARQWVVSWKYHALTLKTTNVSAALAAAVHSKQIHDAATATTVGVPLAQTIVDNYEDMVTALLDYATTPGTLGMIAAHEGANWPSKFGMTVGLLSQWLPNTTMTHLQPSVNFTGMSRIFPTSVRPTVSKTEGNFTLSAVVLSAAPPTSVVLIVSTGVASAAAQTYSLAAVKDARSGQLHSQVFAGSMPLPSSVFQYHLEATASGQTLRWPPQSEQTVVLV